MKNPITVTGDNVYKMDQIWMIVRMNDVLCEYVTVRSRKRLTD